MEKIREAFTGKSAAERDAERDVRKGGTTEGLAATAGGTEYTGGVAGGPAYGGTTAAEGMKTRTATQVPVIQQTTTTTAAVPVAAQTGQVGTEAVCGAEFFTKVEDRPVVKEHVELIQEHHFVEKEFVVETRATGAEREIPGGEVEHLGTTERVVATTPPKPPCE